MNTSLFHSPPLLARKVYAGEVRVVDDIKFWNKITKVVYSRIHSDDNNLNFEVLDSTREISFQTDQITFKDHGGTQLGYIDSSGVINGLSINGHTNNGDFSALEDRVDDLDTDLTDVNTTLALKANTTDVNTTLALKANTTDVNTALALKANTTDVNTALALKANQTAVDTALALKANQTAVDTALALKANTTDVNTSLALKANTTDVDTALALKANQTAVDTALALKANTTFVSTQLALKANTTDVNTSLALKANTTDVNTSLALKADQTDVDDHTTSLASQGGLIQGLYDADYASKTYVTDKDYATETYVNGAVLTATAVQALIDTSITGFASTSQLSATNTAITALDDVVDTKVPKPLNWLTLSGVSATQPSGSLSSYVDNKIDANGDVVFKPSDWSQYPPSIGADTTLKSYTDKKMDVYIDALVDGGSDYLQLRDTVTDGSGNRIGTQKIEFLRTTPTESYGSSQCPDWRVVADSSCSFDIHRKATHPTLGVLYDGNVIEFDQDGDVNIPKVGGLKVNGNEVATKSYTDTTFAAISVEQSVSDLSTTSSSHGQRLTTIEGAGYATTSQLSTYATASSLGTTNTTVGGINTRVNTLENAGYVTSAGLSGYNFATEGYVQTALPDVSNFVTSSTLTTNHYTKSETDTAISNAGGSSSQADTVNIQSFDTGDTDNYLVFTKDSSTGYKGLFEDSALKYDATNNKLTAGELKCDTLHFIDTASVSAKIVAQDLGIDIMVEDEVRIKNSETGYTFFKVGVLGTDAKKIGTPSGTKLGVGNFTPTQPLQVASTTGGSYTLVVNDGGNVGVGINTPSTKLHVYGSGTRTGGFDAYGSYCQVGSNGSVWRNYTENGGRGAGIHITDVGILPGDRNGGIDTQGEIKLGNGSYRFGQIYSTNSSISTSDRNTKQDINDITESERKVATKITDLFKTFRFKDAVSKKGDDARLHNGVIAQDLIEAFKSEGLDVHQYGLFCYDEKWTVDGEHELTETVYEKDGISEYMNEAGEVVKYTVEDEGVKTVKRGLGIIVEKDRPGAVFHSGFYSIRYEELLCFVVAGELQNERLKYTALEARILALETVIANL